MAILSKSDIGNFIKEFGAAGARPSLYEVVITPPGGIKGVDTPEKMTYLCKNAQLPASTIGEIPVSFLGRQIKMPGIRTYENLTLSFYNDEDFSVRHNMEKWMHAIQKFKQPFGNIVNLANSDQGYSSTDMLVRQLSKAGDELRSYKFSHCFPTQVSAIDLGFDQAEAIEEFSVTFAYSYFDIVGGKGSAEGISDGGGGTATT